MLCLLIVIMVIDIWQKTIYAKTLTSNLLKQEYKFELPLKFTTYLQSYATEINNKSNVKYLLYFPYLFKIKTITSYNLANQTVTIY